MFCCRHCFLIRPTLSAYFHARFIYKQFQDPSKAGPSNAFGPRVLIWQASRTVSSVRAYRSEVFVIRDKKVRIGTNLGRATTRQSCIWIPALRGNAILNRASTILDWRSRYGPFLMNTTNVLIMSRISWKRKRLTFHLRYLVSASASTPCNV